MAKVLAAEMKRLTHVPGAPVPADAEERHRFFFVPAPQSRIFIYPVPNIRLAIAAFERPAPGQDPAELRRARTFFYKQMRQVETDKQRRIAIPDNLRRHAGIEDSAQHIALTAENIYLTICRPDLVEGYGADEESAFNAMAEEALNPYTRLEGPTQGSDGSQQ